VRPDARAKQELSPAKSDQIGSIFKL